MSKKFRIVGTNDDCDTCTCCGRTGLKRVVWLQQLDQDGGAEGEPAPYGTTCATRALGWRFPESADTRARLAREAFLAEENRKADLRGAAFRAAVATEIRRGTNRFGVPTAEVVVNGEPIIIEGRGRYGAEAEDDGLRIMARRMFAGRVA